MKRIANRYARFVSVVMAIVVVILIAYQAGYHSAASRLAAATAATDETARGDQSEPRLDVLLETWRLVQREFYRKDAIDQQKMLYGAINGMLESLGDAHTAFATPVHAKISEEDMRGAFDGIGVTVEIRDKRLTVIAPLDGSPGDKAGLRAGDVIAQVDGHDTANLTVMEAVSRIRGPRGTIVRLAVERSGGLERLPFEIVRAEIKMVTVKGQMMDGNVAYIKLTQFSENTSSLLQQQLRELLASKPDALILDLRNNPGGLLSSAVEVASQFVGDGVVLYEERRDAPMQTFYARRGGMATTIPMVVLVNNGSASASEIVAGALQDRGRAVLIGEHSFGKDTVQSVHQLSDQSNVRITIARWYTPERQDIAGKGLSPNIEAGLNEDDHKAGRDPQLERALARLHTGT